MDQVIKPAEKMPPDLKLLGIPLHNVDEAAMHTFMDKVIARQEKALILNVNIHCMMLSLKQPWLHDFMQQSHVTYTDGDGPRWGCQLLGLNPPPKVGFTRWIWDLAGHAEKQGHRLFLLGSAEGVAEQAAAKLTARFPGLKIAGCHHGFFKKEGPENDAVIEKINASGADILILAFGMPIQEHWLKENWLKVQTHIFLPGGAVLEYAAGLLGKSPQWMIDWHLEWLYRLCSDPKRLFWRYAVEIPQFFWAVLLHRTGIRRR